MAGKPLVELVLHGSTEGDMAPAFCYQAVASVAVDDEEEGGLRAGSLKVAPLVVVDLGTNAAAPWDEGDTYGGGCLDEIQEAASP